MLVNLASSIDPLISVHASSWSAILGSLPRMVMTRDDLIAEVSRVVEITRKESEVVVETILESVAQGVRKGDKVELRGFGSFRTRQRAGRIGRNPKTGERVEVPPKTIAFFKPSKEVLKSINSTPAGCV